MKTRVLSLLAVLVFFAAPATAQISLTGPEIPGRSGPIQDTFDYTLTGRVTDLQGHAIDQAHVTIREVASGRIVGTGLTMPDGSFEVERLPRGQYIVVATSGIYQTQQQIAVSSPYLELSLRIPVRRDSGGVSGGDTVSVKQFQVPKKARKLLREAQKAYNGKKHDEAISRTEQALQEFPDFSEALTFRAILYLQDNQGDQARKLTEKAIQDDPTYGLGYIVLGAAYNMLTRFDDALRVLGRAFSFTSQNWQGYYESARAHLGKNEFADALRQVDKAIEYAPKNFSSIHLLRAEACLGLKAYPEAGTSLKAYLELDPNGDAAEEAQRILNQLQAQAGVVASE